MQNYMLISNVLNKFEKVYKKSEDETFAHNNRIKNIYYCYAFRVIFLYE